jgi:hypothetical protein
MSPSRLLLCTDLDRTLIPNGEPSESPGSRHYFARLAAHPQVTLVYVTGRHKALVEEAMETYALPRPDLVISDVGTMIYDTTADTWKAWSSWQIEIKPQWAGFSHTDLSTLFSDLSELRLQEPEKQNTFKLSYYVPQDINVNALLSEMEQRLARNAIHASLIYSVDEAADTGLIDVLPRNATKLHAIQFVREHLGFTLPETVFSGDSGNDLSVLISEVQGTLVANASEQLRSQARSEAEKNGHAESLYIARGGYLGMNGNYSAGILEGIAHYCPYARKWIEE